jgi:Zn-dependent peptidase ImmA (M78 family)/transcriptional regulator with XRE-family HTH domain
MKINGDMLILAREFREVTQQELAEKTRVAQSTIAKIEGGILGEVSDDLGKRIAEALKFPAEFFTQEESLLSYGSSAYFYRKRATMPAPERRRIHSTVNLLRIATRYFVRLVDIEPSRTLPQLDIEEYGRSGAKVARAVRVMWSLPDGPIRDLTAIIETAGVLIIPCDFSTRLFDATSLRLSDMPPMIFINSNMPGDRWRYTLAHELAHLIMHTVPHPHMEEEADDFASEFLTPEAEIRPQLSLVRTWQIRELAQLKLFWRVSFHMLVMRAKQLGVISKERARRIFIALAPERTMESVPIEKEQTKSFWRVVSAITDELSFGQEGLKALVRWPQDVIELLLPFSPVSVPKLRLIHS